MNPKQKVEKTTFPNIKNIIVVASGKGGVGKSTVAAGLALSLAREGYATGLMDADIYGPSAPTLFNWNSQRPTCTQQGEKNVIHPISALGIKVMSIGFFIDPKQAMLWRGPMASGGLKQLMTETDWGELDYLIIDTPPGTGDIHLTLMQEYNINGVVIVTTPQMVAIDDVQKAIGMFNNGHLGVPVIGIIENMAWFTPSKHLDEKYFLFGQGGGEHLSKMFNIPLIAQIPLDESICGNCDEGKLNGLFKNSAVQSAFDTLVAGIIKLKEVAIK